MKTKYTPSRVESLLDNEIFVFGSTLKGAHKGGAAKLAVEKFGAVMGKGDGLQGQSYAIPSMQSSLTRIIPYVTKFISYASNHPENVFIVTKIGCGRAGFKVEDMAPLFEQAYALENVILPEEFCSVILAKHPEWEQETVEEQPAPSATETPVATEEQPEIYKPEVPTLGVKVVGKIDVSKYERKKKEIKPNKRNLYIIDTNVFVECPDVINRIGKDYEVVLSAKVVDELDKLKTTLDGERKLNAQKALRLINAAIGKRAIKMEYADPSLLPDDYDKKSPDNLILSVALKFRSENPIMLTSDNGLQVKAKIAGITTITLKEFLQH